MWFWFVLNVARVRNYVSDNVTVKSKVSDKVDFCNALGLDMSGFDRVVGIPRWYL